MGVAEQRERPSFVCVGWICGEAEVRNQISMLTGVAEQRVRHMFHTVHL